MWRDGMKFSRVVYMIALNKNKIILYACSLIVAAILLLCISWGSSSGRSNAQAEIVDADAHQAVLALKYFYQDQGRFPSDQEFTDKNAMGTYFNIYPLPNFPSSVCQQSFIYNRVSPTSYELSFCLVAPTGGDNQGWNKISGTPPAN